MTTPLFQASDLVVRYGRITALDQLSLTVGRGERIALLGANGSGKSTLLRVLDALVFPESGVLHFAGEPIVASRFEEREFTFAFRKRVGLVFQNPDVQLFNPTVFDELAFGPLQLRWPASEIRERVEEVLASMRIEHLRDRSPHQLSGGEKKRVAIASVMVLDPEVLLLDEPTSALDPKSHRQIVDLLASWSGGEKTVITATHDLGNLEEISDRCFVFEKGKIVKEASALEVLHDVPLLQRVNLVSAHRHSHEPGQASVHSHLHSN
jgi:cobalt/nickel transport system ATP-binding protein